MKLQADISDNRSLVRVAAGRSLAVVLGRLFACDERHTMWAAALGAAIVACVGVPLAALLNIWTDEAFTLHTTGAGPLAAWSNAISFETQPPLYFLLLGVWRLANENSVFFARIPSIAFAAAGVAVVVITARRVAPRIPPFAVALITAFNPLVIWSAVEMRVYALVFVIGALLMWTFVEGFLAPAPSRWARIGYAVCAIAGLYTQFYVGFFLVANLLTLAAVRRGSLRGFVVAGMVVTAAFAPFVATALAEARSSGGFVARVSFVHAVHELSNAVYAMLLPHVYDFGVTRFATLAVAIGLAAVIVGFGRPAIPADAVSRGVLAQWLICFVLFSFVFAISGVPSSLSTHIIVIAPVSLLAALLVLSSLTRRVAVAGLGTAGVYAAFALTTLLAMYHPPLYKTGEWQRVAAAIAPDAPTTPTAVFPAESQLALNWYLAAPTIPVPRAMPFNSTYVQDTSLTSVADVARVLDPVRARSDRLWVVTTNCDATLKPIYNYHCNYLEAYLAARYHLVKRLAFRGSDARLYQRNDRAPAPPR